VQSRVQKPRRRRVRRDYTLIVLDFFARIGRAIASAYRRARKMHHFRVVSAFAVIVFAIIVAIIAFYATSRPNALEVYLDDTQIGAVRLDGNREITLEYITLHATTRLGSQLDGSRVRFSQEINANPVRLSVGAPTLTFDNLISSLVDAIDYYVYGAVIAVDGEEVVLLPSVVAAEIALGRFAYSFRIDATAAFNYQFLNEVSVERRYVHDTELMTTEKALEVLGSSRSTNEIYIVQSGDTFSQIALNMGMTTSALSARNPNVNPDVLQIGQRLSVIRTAPILNVVTTEMTGSEAVTRINGVVQ